MEHIIIDNTELIILLQIQNPKYGTVKICKTLDFSKDVYVINNKIINDKAIISEIEKMHGLKLPDEVKNILF